MLKSPLQLPSSPRTQNNNNTDRSQVNFKSSMVSARMSAYQTFYNLSQHEPTQKTINCGDCQKCKHLKRMDELEKACAKYDQSFLDRSRGIMVQNKNKRQQVQINSGGYGLYDTNYLKQRSEYQQYLENRAQDQTKKYSLPMNNYQNFAFRQNNPRNYATSGYSIPQNYQHNNLNYDSPQSYFDYQPYRGITSNFSPINYEIPEIPVDKILVPNYVTTGSPKTAQTSQGYHNYQQNPFQHQLNKKRQTAQQLYDQLIDKIAFVQATNQDKISQTLRQVLRSQRTAQLSQARFNQLKDIVQTICYRQNSTENKIENFTTSIKKIQDQRQTTNSKQINKQIQEFKERQKNILEQCEKMKRINLQKENEREKERKLEHNRILERQNQLQLERRSHLSRQQQLKTIISRQMGQQNKNKQIFQRKIEGNNQLRNGHQQFLNQVNDQMENQNKRNYQMIQSNKQNQFQQRLLQGTLNRQNNQGNQIINQHLSEEQNRNRVIQNGQLNHNNHLINNENVSNIPNVRDHSLNNSQSLNPQRSIINSNQVQLPGQIFPLQQFQVHNGLNIIPNNNKSQLTYQIGPNGHIVIPSGQLNPLTTNRQQLMNSNKNHILSHHTNNKNVNSTDFSLSQQLGVSQQLNNNQNNQFSQRQQNQLNNQRNQQFQQSNNQHQTSNQQQNRSNQNFNNKQNNNFKNINQQNQNLQNQNHQNQNHQYQNRQRNNYKNQQQFQINQNSDLLELSDQNQQNYHNSRSRNKRSPSSKHTGQRGVEANLIPPRPIQESQSTQSNPNIKRTQQDVQQWINITFEQNDSFQFKRRIARLFSQAQKYQQYLEQYNHEQVSQYELQKVRSLIDIKYQSVKNGQQYLNRLNNLIQQVERSPRTTPRNRN